MSTIPQSPDTTQSHEASKEPTKPPLVSSDKPPSLSNTLQPPTTTTTTTSSSEPTTTLHSPLPSPSASPSRATTPNPISAITKPRSDSILQSSRPAPPSPASSRRSSQIFTHSPVLSGTSGTSTGAFRDRSGSSSSSRVGLGLGLAPSSATGATANRRISSTGSSTANSSNRLSQVETGSSTGARRLSTLRHSMQISDFEVEGVKDGLTVNSSVTSSAVTSNTESLAVTPIPENTPPEPSSPSAETQTPNDAVTSTPTQVSTLPSEEATSNPSASAVEDTDPSSPALAVSTQDQPLSSSIPPPPEKGKILIRDYGFPPSDERFHGYGQVQTSPLKQKWRFSGLGFGSSSISSGLGSTSPGNTDSDRAEDEGRKGWGFGGFLGWKGFIKRRASSTSASATGSTSRSGSRTSSLAGGEEVMVHDEPEDVGSDSEEFRRTSIDIDGGGGSGIGISRIDGIRKQSGIRRDSDDDDNDDDRNQNAIIDDFSDDGDGDGDGDLDDDLDLDYDTSQEATDSIGIFRAAYPFEAEGDNEMSLEEGEIIELRGRGGGEGWVIAFKDGKEGLVPESYLEPYHADDYDDDDDGDDEEDEKGKGSMALRGNVSSGVGGMKEPTSNENEILLDVDEPMVNQLKSET